MPNHLVRLFVHESTRVYSDKLINFEDKKLYEQLLIEILRKNIPVIKMNLFFFKKLIYVTLYNFSYI